MTCLLLVSKSNLQMRHVFKTFYNQILQFILYAIFLRLLFIIRKPMSFLHNRYFFPSFREGFQLVCCDTVMFCKRTTSHKIFIHILSTFYEAIGILYSFITAYLNDDIYFAKRFNTTN